MPDTWNKKEREKRKKQSKIDKAEKKVERKENKSTDFESMIAYIDENGNLSSTPPDPKKKFKVNAEDIEISVPRQEALNPEDLIHTGVVTFFNTEKGYGFIKDKETNESVFVHVQSVAEPIKENNLVSFETEKGPKGVNAVNVKQLK
jgi:cold shock CspA family protein